LSLLKLDIKFGFPIYDGELVGTGADPRFNVSKMHQQNPNY
jgi:hypothetical protein